MAEEDSDALFALTKRVREAVSLINSLDEGRLAVVVKRLARAVGGRYAENARPHYSESSEHQGAPSRKTVALNQPAGAWGFCVRWTRWAHEGWLLNSAGAPAELARHSARRSWSSCRRAWSCRPLTSRQSLKRAPSSSRSAHQPYPIVDFHFSDSPGQTRPPFSGRLPSSIRDLEIDELVLP